LNVSTNSLQITS